tara:strand:+ start:328 stop:3714 length:3387 start_codon:yes stop_codon:yes gene_type:complete
MALVNMTSNLQWVGTSADAPGKLSQTNIQNKITSYQEGDIREQYNKFLIYDTPNINRLSFGRATDQPFIIRGIQRNDGDPQFYGPGGRTSPQNMLVRGGLVAFAARLAEDAIRMGKFLLSPKGLIWNLKQVGLQSSNPNVESPLTIRPTKSFNPVEFAKNFITAPEGIHKRRHGGGQVAGRYEEVQKQFLQDDAESVKFNRLARLKIELLGDGEPGAVDQQAPTDLFGQIVQGVSNFVAPLQNALSGFTGAEIKELSGPGGPSSVYGIGFTNIRRTVTTGNVLKEQGGPHQGKAFWGIHYTNVQNYESEATPGKPRTLESTSAPGNSIEKTYTPKQSDGYPENALLPNKDAESGGDGLINVQEKYTTEENYIDVEGPAGPVLSETADEDTINRVKVDTQTGLIGDSGKSIIEGTPETDTNTFPIGEKYLESNSPAQNKSREEGSDDNPGGGRFVGSSFDASEETQKRAKNSEDKDLLEHANKYHVFQNRDADFPEGYYNLANSNGGPRGKPIGGSKHNIFTSLEAEADLIRTLVDGKKLTEHIHTFLGESTQGVQTREPSTTIIDRLSIGYEANQLRAFPIVGEDWDTADRINLYQLIDPQLGDSSNVNTPQIRKSAERVFDPGFPVNAKGEANLLANTPQSGLNAVEVGEKIFNYFTPDLKFFTGITREQLDDGPSHDYIGLKLKYVQLESGDDQGNILAYIYGLKDPTIVPTYNEISYAPKFTPADPKVGASPEAGQAAISGQTTRTIEEVDAEIVSKLDPLKNDKARPDETSNVKTIGGKPLPGAGTPLVYNYMNYSELRAAAKAGGVLNPKKIQEFRRAVSSAVKSEIEQRSRDQLGYGGATQPDAIQQLKVGQKPSKEDLVPFFITSQGGGEAVYFRAGINSISDSFSPEWATEKEIGRADPKILLSGFARAISLDLTLAAGSESELVPMWSKINKLAGWTAPNYVGNGYTGNFVELTLGDIYQGVPCYITSLGVDVDNESPWEITSGIRAPKYCNVSIELAYVGKSIPQNGTKFYDIAPFSGRDVSRLANTAVDQLPGAFDAVEDLLPPGTPSQLPDEPYNMAKDVLGDIGSGIASAGDSVVDFFLPGDQSGDNAFSSKVSDNAKKFAGGAKKIFNNLNPFG